mmetsp:Transcript_35371/g.54139  ORF Transcript_35371/g.54139 Transcript_35371/m.54139 type:complete len:117 (+) Transcript_35371:1535-1885(+)
MDSSRQLMGGRRSSRISVSNNLNLAKAESAPPKNFRSLPPLENEPNSSSSFKKGGFMKRKIELDLLPEEEADRDGEEVSGQITDYSDEPRQNLCMRFFAYMSECSCFVLHRDTMLR